MKARRTCCYCRRSNPTFKVRNDLEDRLMVTPLPCPNAGCEQFIIKRLLINHSTKECDCAALICLFCRKSFMKKEYLEHAVKEHLQQLRRLMIQHSN